MLIFIIALYSLTYDLRRNIRTKRFLGHVITRCRIRSAATATANLPITTDTALTFEAVTVTHSCKVFAVVPNLSNVFFQYVSAFYRDQSGMTKRLWDEVRLWASAAGYDLGPVRQK